MAASHIERFSLQISAVCSQVARIPRPIARGLPSLPSATGEPFKVIPSRSRGFPLARQASFGRDRVLPRNNLSAIFITETRAHARPASFETSSELGQPRTAANTPLGTISKGVIDGASGRIFNSGIMKTPFGGKCSLQHAEGIERLSSRR